MKSATLDIHSTINEFVQEDFRRSSFFENLGIDACCGGQKTLAEVCMEKAIDPEKVLKQMGFPVAESSPPKIERDWSEAALGELVDHIEKTHHAYLKNALPILLHLIEKVEDAHGERHPELEDLGYVFLQLKDDLVPHMMKEERVLFPMVRQLDAGLASQGFHCGSPQGPIRVMRAEHERVDTLLDKIREITNDFTQPEDGCTTYRLMLAKLKELKADLDIHIQLENDILFPKALEEMEGSSA